MEWKKLLCPERIRSYHGNPGSSDLRTEFEKDYHRIIGSASFRRLQDKTQVFPLDKSDFVRTRLTHSLEVSSFGKSLGQNISQSILQLIKDDTFLPSYAVDVCDILQCAGLLHDIGNPPFGHFGETVIREWFTANLPRLVYKGERVDRLLTEQMIGDFWNFEGNTQALRVVTKLHYLVDRYGMNLTKGLLGTIIKYPVSSLLIDKGSGDIHTKKMGYYYADQDTFYEIQAALGTQERRHPLAFVLEAADDIAYLTADIEDAYKKGCITYDQLLRELHEAEEGQPEDGEYCKLVQNLEYKYRRALEKKEEKPDAYAVHNWIVNVQGRLIYSATSGFTRNYRAIMEGSYDRELLSDSFGGHTARVLGDIAYRYAFVSTPIVKIEIAADTILSFLLDRFVNAILYYDTDRRLTAVQEKLVSLISDNYKAAYKINAEGKGETEKLYLRLLLVTDYVCGMTDSYAKTLYQEMNGKVQ